MNGCTPSVALIKVVRKWPIALRMTFLLALLKSTDVSHVRYMQA